MNDSLFFFLLSEVMAILQFLFNLTNPEIQIENLDGDMVLMLFKRVLKYPYTIPVARKYAHPLWHPLSVLSRISSVQKIRDETAQASFAPAWDQLSAGVSYMDLLICHCRKYSSANYHVRRLHTSSAPSCCCDGGLATGPPQGHPNHAPHVAHHVWGHHLVRGEDQSRRR